MKVQNITDIDAFFKAVDECKGKVELVTGEGDRLNLKFPLRPVKRDHFLTDQLARLLILLGYPAADEYLAVHFQIVPVPLIVAREHDYFHCSQYVSMANIFSNGEIPELEIIAYEKEDTDRLIKFMLDGE